MLLSLRHAALMADNRLVNDMQLVEGVDAHGECDLSFLPDAHGGISNRNRQFAGFFCIEDEHEVSVSLSGILRGGHDLCLDDRDFRQGEGLAH